jgi:hypothetical protein
VEKLAELAGPTDFAFLEHLQWCSPYVTLHKYFSHPSLVIHFFSTPLMKLKLGQGTAKRWGTTISKPPGRISMMGESETLSNSQIILITLFYAGE